MPTAAQSDFAASSETGSSASGGSGSFSNPSAFDTAWPSSWEPNPLHETHQTRGLQGGRNPLPISNFLRASPATCLHLKQGHLLSAGTAQEVAGSTLRRNSTLQKASGTSCPGGSMPQPASCRLRGPVVAVSSVTIEHLGRDCRVHRRRVPRRDANCFTKAYRSVREGDGVSA
jgi:hypothetical protein